MGENVTLPSDEEIAELPRWARAALAARCARRVLPLFLHDWPKAPASHVQSITETVLHAEVGAATASVPFAAMAASVSTTSAAAAVASAQIAAGVADAVAAAAETVETVSSRDFVLPVVATIVSAVAAGVTAASVRYDFDTLRQRATAGAWTDDTPVPPTVFGPMWPFGTPKDWPPEDAGDRLAVTLAPPPDATPEQIAGFQIRLYEALNKLAIANGGAGLKVDSLGREVPVLAPAGVGE